MPNADFFSDALKNDGRAYALYRIVYGEGENDVLSIGQCAHVVEVGKDDNYASGFYAIIKIKDKEYRVDRALLMPRIHFLRLVNGITSRMIQKAFPDKKKSGD